MWVKFLWITFFVLVADFASAISPDPDIICKKKSSCVRNAINCKVWPEVRWRQDRYAEIKTTFSYILDVTYNCMSENGSVAELVDQEKVGPLFFQPSGEYDYDKYEFNPPSKEEALNKATTELLGRCEFSRTDIIELYTQCSGSQTP